MGYIMDASIIILLCLLQPTLTISTHHVRAVSPKSYYQNIPPPPDKTNWEIGLKEATYQALLREQITHPQLKEEIYSSSIEGYQDTATPFGDIAVLARGQLFGTSHGYQFVQDPYQNDCDDCHNKPPKCDRQQCEPQNTINVNDLVALWTVKRIRHRDPKFGHRYELQFTISPMSPAANAQFVTRNGRFDYSIPGHVFIVKLKDDGETSRLQTDRRNYKRYDLKEHSGSVHKEHRSPNWPQPHFNPDEVYNPAVRGHNHYYLTPNSLTLNTGEYYLPEKHKTHEDVYDPGFLIGISPNGYKHIIRDIPGLVERPYIDNKHFDNKHYERPHDNIPKEPVKQYHHHFYIPEVEDIDYDKKTRKPVLPTVLTSTTKKEQYITSVRPTGSTGPTSEIPTKFVLTTNQIPETSTTPKQIFTTQSQVGTPLTTDQGYTLRTTYKYPDTTIPITINPTPFFTPDLKYPTESGFIDTTNYPRTTLYKIITVPSTNPTQSTSFSPSPIYIQYSEPDPIYNNNQPPTVPTFGTQKTPSVKPTTPTLVTVQNEPERKTTLIDVYGEEPTYATTPASSTTTKVFKYPDSINVQLPPPEKGADTTIPYVSSTAVTIISTPTPVPTENIEDNQSELSERKTTTLQDKIYTTIKDKGTTNAETTPTATDAYSTKFDKSDKSKGNEITSTINNEENTATSLSDMTTKAEISTDYKTATTEAMTSTTANRKIGNGDIFANSNRRRKPNKSKVVYEEEFDIFGDGKKTESATETMKITKLTPISTRANAFDEIFGDFVKPTASEKIMAPHSTQSTNSSPTARNARLNKYLKYRRTKTNRRGKFGPNNDQENTEKSEVKPTDDAEDVETKTSQSYITSISYKVNKNKKADGLSTPSTTHPENDKTKTDFDHKTEKAERNTMTTTDASQTFDDVAQTLVNHARVVTYFNTKSTKPTRRSYKPTQR